MKKELFLLGTLCLLLSATAQTSKMTFKTGEAFRDCPDCPEMVALPSGEFIMGSTEKELGHTMFTSDNMVFERPQHKETIKRFAVGKFDVTKADYAAFVKATNRKSACGCAWAYLAGDSTPWMLNRSANWNHLGFPQDSTHPVVCITYADAHDYADWLSKKTGKQYRLLTESEWEYASRAGTNTAYPWGDSASRDYANYGTDTTVGVGHAEGKDKWVYTSPVGSFPPNPWGLYDMQGNVLQWVEDCMSIPYHNYGSDGSAYRSDDTLHTDLPVFSNINGKKSCSFHICRGGDFGDPPALIRSASRNYADVTDDPATNYSSSGLSFRLARSF